MNINPANSRPSSRRMQVIRSPSRTTPLARSSRPVTTGTCCSSSMAWKIAPATFGSNTEATCVVSLNAGPPCPTFENEARDCQFQAESFW